MSIDLDRRTLCWTNAPLIPKFVLPRGAANAHCRVYVQYADYGAARPATLLSGTVNLRSLSIRKTRCRVQSTNSGKLNLRVLS
jgi:hypothetical protein